MKPYILIPFALLIGLLLGGWGPRSELKTLKEELRHTKQLLKEGAGRRGAARDVADVTRLLGIAQDRPAVTADAADPEQTQGEPEESNEGETASPSETSEDEPDLQVAESKQMTEEEKEAKKKEHQQRMADDLEEAIELWRLRSQIARSTFLANGDFSEKETIAFDVLMKSMNIRLGHAIDVWVDEVEGKEDAGAEDGVRLMHGVTEAIVLTYDAMDQELPEDWRETGGEGLRLFDFIDPAVAEPIIRVEDRLNDIAESIGPSEIHEEVE